MIVAVQEEGDFLYFPPNWGHAVLTKKGPNAMLNLRETAVDSSFMELPFRAIEAVLAVITSKFSNRIYSHTHLSVLQKALTFHSNMTDSPCASLWKEMLNIQH